MNRSSAAGRVLVVDDEENIRALLTSALHLAEFETREAPTGAAALAAVPEFEPDLVLLDVMLPDLDGFEVARQLRAGDHDVPIVFLTARHGVPDRVTGMTAGGDDYVSKPFSLEELVLRIRAILRRVRSRPPETHDTVLRFADVELCEEEYAVRRGDSSIELSVTELNLLRFLMINPGRVLTRAQILDRVWGYEFVGDVQIVDTYVYYLRKKLERHGPRLIQTVRGIGYALRQPADA